MQLRMLIQHADDRAHSSSVLTWGEEVYFDVPVVVAEGRAGGDHAG